MIKQVMWALLFSTVGISCTSVPQENRNVASMLPGKISQNYEDLDSVSDLKIEDIEASMGVTSPESRQQELDTYFQGLCEKNPMDCVHAVGGKGTVVRATLLKKKGRYHLEVEKNGAPAYSCLASPGARSFLGIDPEYGLTPKVANIQPHGIERVHVVSSTKSYAGAKMRWTVWVIGGVAIHAGQANGYRKSHGCINVPPECAEQFFNDVANAGIQNTFITVQDN